MQQEINDDILRKLCEYPIGFKASDVDLIVNENYNISDLTNAIINSNYFLVFKSHNLSESFFISKNTIFKWYSDLSITLARNKKFKLSSDELKAYFQLRNPSQLLETVDDIVHIGIKLGFIGIALQPNYYVFPIAQVLSILKENSMVMAKDILHSIDFRDFSDSYFKEKRDKAFEELLSFHDIRIPYIVKARAGLINGNKVTLADLGNYYGVTRERIRQLEQKFWRKVRLQKYRPLVITSFLCDFILNGGKLIIQKDNSYELLKTRLLAKMYGLKEIEIKDFNIIIFGTVSSEIDIADFTNSIKQTSDRNTLIYNLESKLKMFFPKEDVSIILDKETKITKIEKIYIALKTIGRPAHYSEITEMYQSLFPDDYITEHYIHSVIGNNKNKIVWIGVKGTYALREWGYEQPDNKIHDLVARIVAEKYNETKKPVSFETIIAELGKYRRIVNRNSIIIASTLNPKIEQVTKNYFIPKISENSVTNENEDLKLDEIFRSFEKTKDNNKELNEIFKNFEKTKDNDKETPKKSQVELKAFISERIKFSHLYQPLLIKELIESGGKATIRQLAIAVLKNDEKQISYYENRLRDMPFKVLSKYGIISLHEDIVALNVKNLSYEEKAEIIKLCEEKIHEFISNRGQIW